MTPFVAMALLIAYFMLSIEVYLATYCLTVSRLSFWGIGPTELRLVLAAGTLALLSDPKVKVLGEPYIDCSMWAARSRPLASSSRSSSRWRETFGSFTARSRCHEGPVRGIQRRRRDRVRAATRDALAADQSPRRSLPRSRHRGDRVRHPAELLRPRMVDLVGSAGRRPGSPSPLRPVSHRQSRYLACREQSA